MQFITTQLQFNQNNSFSTIIQFHYNYTHDVMLMSLIVIHLLNSDTWHYEKFWTFFFSKILIFVIHYDYQRWSEVMTCDTIKIVTWHINCILEKNKK